MRTVFYLSLFLMTSCSGSLKKPGKNSSDECPNIIFLLTDDQRANTLGITGHPVIKTPNLDKLAGQGVRFSNAYIAEPICSPSRVSFFTGVHERVHGIGFTSSYELTEDQWRQTYPAILRDAGYYTGFIGKFGVEYYTFRGKASDKFDFWKGHDGWTRFFPKDYDTESCTPYHKAQKEIITSIMGEYIDAFFDSLPRNIPFCLSVSFNVPHGSQLTSMYTDCRDPQALNEPANRNPRLKGHPFYDTLYRVDHISIPEDCETDPYRFIPANILNQDGRKAKTYKYDYNRKSCYEHHIRYYQAITGVDEVIGNLMSKLDTMGLSDNTVIIFTSDHGLLMGEYGMGGKALLYDLVSKIPCIIFDPSIPAQTRDRVIDRFVSSIDITSTILDYAGIDIPEYMTGNSLIPLIEDQNVAWRDEIFLESLYTGRSNPFCEGIRRGKWKYIRMYPGNRSSYSEEDLVFNGRKPGFEQLFDLENDPAEHHNLIPDFEGSVLLEELRTACAEYSNSLNKSREKYKKEFRIQRRN